MKPIFSTAWYNVYLTNNNLHDTAKFCRDHNIDHCNDLPWDMAIGNINLYYPAGTSYDQCWDFLNWVQECDHSDDVIYNWLKKYTITEVAEPLQHIDF